MYKRQGLLGVAEFHREVLDVDVRHHGVLPEVQAAVDGRHQLVDVRRPEQGVVVGRQLDDGRRLGGVPAAAVEERVLVPPRLEDGDGCRDPALPQFAEGVVELEGRPHDPDDPAHQVRVQAGDALADETGEALVVPGHREAALQQRTVDRAGEDREQDRHEGPAGVVGGPLLGTGPGGADLGRTGGDQEHVVDRVAGLLQLVRGLEGHPGPEGVAPQGVRALGLDLQQRPDVLGRHLPDRRVRDLARVDAVGLHPEERPLGAEAFGQQPQVHRVAAQAGPAEDRTSGRRR